MTDFALLRANRLKLESRLTAGLENLETVIAQISDSKSVVRATAPKTKRVSPLNMVEIQGIDTGFRAGEFGGNWRGCG